MTSNLFKRTENAMIQQFDSITKEEYLLLLAGAGFCGVCAGQSGLGLTKEFRTLGCIGCTGVLGKALMNRKKKLEKEKRELSEVFDEYESFPKQPKQKTPKQKKPKKEEPLESPVKDPFDALPAPVLDDDDVGVDVPAPKPKVPKVGKNIADKMKMFQGDAPKFESHHGKGFT